MGALVSAMSARGVAQRRRNVSRTDLTTPFIMFMIRRDQRLLEQGLDFAQCTACIPDGANCMSDTPIDELTRSVFHLSEDAIMKVYRYKTKGERDGDGWIDDMRGTHFASRLQPEKAVASEVRAYVAHAAPSAKRTVGGCDDTKIRSASSGEGKPTSTKAESGLMTIVCPHLCCCQFLSLIGSETFRDAFTLQTLYADAVGCKHFSKDNCCAYIKWLDVHASAIYDLDAVAKSEHLSDGTKLLLKTIFDRRTALNDRADCMELLVALWHQTSHVPRCQELNNQHHVDTAGTLDGEFNERHNRPTAKLGMLLLK